MRYDNMSDETQQSQTPDDGETRSTASARITDATVLVDMPHGFGHYKLTRLLGRGGMGEVWLAFDTKLERDVALKAMRRELLTNEEAVKRFYREARAVARLNHPNIVQVYSIGEEKQIIYFVMELVEGDTLSNKLKTHGIIPLRECVRILLQCIEGMSYAYARGIIHRDIKPSNIMVTTDGRIKIADFGLAKMIEHDSQMTAAGTTMGSPNYMSPEQARGEEADHRSDIYALGITFYQMITGHLPFTAETPLSVLLMQIQQPLPEPDELRMVGDGRVLEIIKKMSAKSAAGRYQTYTEMAEAITTLAPDARIRPSALTATATMATPQELKLRGKDAARDAMAADQQVTAPSATPVEARKKPAPVARKWIVIAATGIVALVAVVALIFSLTALRTRKATAERAAGQLFAQQRTQSESATPAAIAIPSPDAVAPATTPMISIPPATATPMPSPAPQQYTPISMPLITPGPPPISPITPLTPAGYPTTVIVTPTPTPTPTVFTSSIILGSDRVMTGAAVSVYDEAGQPAARTLRAGDRADLVRLDQATNRYQIRYNGRLYYVSVADAHQITDQLGALQRPRLSPGSATPKPALARLIVLGMPDGTGKEEISVFDEAGKRELQKMRAGTELQCVGDSEFYYIVLLDSGRRGQVLKKLARPKP